MNIIDIILSISMSVFLITTAILGIYLIITDLREKQQFKKTVKTYKIPKKSNKRLMIIKTVYQTGEYHFIDKETGIPYEIYLPGTNLKTNDTVLFKFSKGHISYKIK